MNIKRNTLLVLAATVIVAFTASLTGCAPDSNDYDNSLSREESAQPLLYINESTGRITKIIDSDGKVTFNEGYTSKDIKIEEGPAGFKPYDFVTLNDTVEVDGKSYPVSSTLKWDYSPSGDYLVPFFNKNIASAATDSVAMLQNRSVVGVVQTYIHDHIAQAVSDGQLPKAQYELTGESSVLADAKVAQMWVDRVPAWEAYRTVSGSIHPGQYHYSFNCTTNGIAGNGNALTEAAGVLFEEAGLQFGFSLKSLEVTSETVQPCAAVQDVLSPKDPSQDPYPTGNAPTGGGPNEPGVIPAPLAPPAPPAHYEAPPPPGVNPGI